MSAGRLQRIFSLELPERRMTDNAVVATDYQRRRRGRVLAESFVVTAEGIGFGEGTSVGVIE